MLRSNLSLWFGLATIMLIICMLSHNIEMKMTKLHMGILETRPEYLNNMEQVQSGGSALEEDEEGFERLQCSYALTALYYMMLIEELLYSYRKFIFIDEYDHIMFDVEAALMLVTVQSLPFYNYAVNTPWTLWFYLDKVRRLLEAFSEGVVINPQNTQVMTKVHQSIVESLRLFVESRMGKFQDVQKKLDEIDNVNTSRIDIRATISKNKQLLNNQIKFNEQYGFSTEGIKHLKFKTLSTFDKLENLKTIVVEYLGTTYWTFVEVKFHELYAIATNVNSTISQVVTYLWHIKNGVNTIIKHILLKFIENLFSESDLDATSEMTFTDKVDATKLVLMEFCEFIGRPSDCDGLVLKFLNGYTSLDVIKKYFTSEKEFHPYLYYNIKNKMIKRYYLLLVNVRTKEISNKINTWTNVDFFREKVKDFFSNVNTNILNAFYKVPYTRAFKKVKEIEHPRN